MAADINRQRVGISAGAGHEHGAHLVDAHGQSRRFAPGLEQLAPLLVCIGQRLAIIAPGNAGPNLGHLHQALPEPIAIDPKVLAGRGHVVCS